MLGYTLVACLARASITKKVFIIDTSKHNEVGICCSRNALQGFQKFDELEKKKNVYLFRFAFHGDFELSLKLHFTSN
jgi:hypothetical protein